MPEPLLLECRHSNSESSMHIHFHNAYELLFIKSGCVKMRIALAHYEIKAPALVFISSFEEHEIFITAYPYERYYAIFSIEETNKMINDIRLNSIFKNRPRQFCHVFDCGSFVKNVEYCMQEFLNESPKEEFNNMYTASLLYQLLIKTYRQFPNSFPYPRRTFRKEIYDIQAFIEQNFSTNLSIQQLAAQFFIDSFYLTHAFKELTGYSPKQYVMLYRISHARALLLETSLSVSEIAEKCGFGDINNFIRSFKKSTGVSPSHYRLQK